MPDTSLGDDTMQPRAMSAGATLALVRAVRGIRYEEIPADALEAARHCLLDSLGCALAGSREPLTGILLESVARSEDGGAAALIGRRERTTWLAAALVNGAAGHALDFDDTHTVMSGHPSAPVLPALLALVQREGAGGPPLPRRRGAAQRGARALGGSLPRPRHALQVPRRVLPHARRDRGGEPAAHAPRPRARTDRPRRGASRSFAPRRLQRRRAAHRPGGK